MSGIHVLFCQVLLCLALAASFSSASADESKSPALRQEIGKPVQAAIDALKSRKAKEALMKIREAESVGADSAYESYIINRIKGQAAALSGEPNLAIEALEASLASSAIPPADRIPLLGVLAGQYYTARNYPKAAEVAARYAQQGGEDPALRTLEIQSLYLAGDLPRAGKEIQTEIQIIERGGKVPSEQLLQMAADIANRQKDGAGMVAVMEKLITHYPKPSYWLNLVYSLSTMNGLSQQLTLDVYRVKLATGTMRSSDEFVEGAQYALLAGFPVEAKKFLDAGYASNMLGSGQEAERHKRLREVVEKKLAEDIKTLGQDDSLIIKSANADAMMNTGFNYVLHGKSDKGLAMMADALKIGGFKRPEDARLHFGVAQILAGRNAQGMETLKAVKGSDGTAELAKLWMLYAQR